MVPRSLPIGVLLREFRSRSGTPSAAAVSHCRSPQFPMVLTALIDVPVFFYSATVRLATPTLLPFGDGRALHGPINTVLSLDNLARLYGCAFHELRDGAHRCFLPA